MQVIRAPGHERDLLQQSDGFDIEVYREHFAPFPWTHIRGFRQLSELLLLQPRFNAERAVTEYLKGLWPLVGPETPKDWQAFKFKNQHWHLCHPTQIAKICGGGPASLDHCCHATLALQIAFERAQNKVVRKIDVYNYIEFAPAAYALRNLSDVAKAWLKGTVRPDHARDDAERFGSLVASLCPADGKDHDRDRLTKARQFLSNVADEHALTFENAQFIRNFVAGPWGTPMIVPLKARSDTKRRERKSKRDILLRACDSESEFVNLGATKFVELQERIDEAKRYIGR